MFIIQGHRFAHNGRVMNIILGADYADYTDFYYLAAWKAGQIIFACKYSVAH